MACLKYTKAVKVSRTEWAKEEKQELRKRWNITKVRP
jgi:hypothetical protein